MKLTSSSVIKSLQDCDPRDHQLTVLTSMLAYGLFWLRFDLNKLWLLGIVAVALMSQYVATRLWKLPCFEWKSAAISGLSLAILMRSPSLAISLGLAFVAIFSKFLLRWEGKHIFNPTNFALVLGILVTGQVAIAPNQWGNGAILAFFIVCMGSFVVNRAARSDISFAFLVSYAGLVFLRAAWNGTSLSEPMNRLQTGSLLVFAFFMISDPKTTPNSHLGRLIFGTTVALVGAYLQLILQIPAGLLIALAFLSVTVPAIDRIFYGSKYQWKANCAHG
jgi:Na+-translocating ferredoxin:NAD+ oxidoreductase RnfD subunit